MVYRMLPACLAALALVFFAAAPAWAAKEKSELKMHEGKVVSVVGHKLVMTMNGKEHTHTIAENAKVHCDGKICKLDDLKPGMKIRVWTPANDLTTAVRIDAIEKNKEFQKQNK